MEMSARWILIFCILYINQETISSEYYDSNEQYSEESEDLREPEEYDGEPYEYVHRRASRHKKTYAPATSDECSCSCQRCKKPEPKPCCKQVCYYCQQAAASYSTENPNIVFVPYPVPLVVPNIYKNSTGKSDTTTTTNAPATTNAPTTQKATTNQVLRMNSLEEMMSGHHRTMKELNPDSKLKTRPSWMPKYGIVPIPDRLAAKLMSQLIEVRSLKGKKRL